jgi:MFS family permease
MKANTETQPASRLPKTFSALRHRNFQLWFMGQLVSFAGTWMQSVAQSWLVYQLSHSEWILGVVGFVSAIPYILVSPWGGVVSDNVSKRNLLVVTQSVSMILAFVLSFLTFSGTVQVWHVVVLSIILGVVNTFDAPARQSFVVEMVGREDLGNAIALNSVLINGARVIGPGLAGILLPLVGPAWCFAINGFSFIAVIIGLLAMRIPKTQDQVKKTGNPWEQYKAGLDYVKTSQPILALLGIAAVFSVFGLSYTVLLPAFVDKVLHAGAGGYGLFNTVFGVGAVIAALIIARYGEGERRRRFMLVSSLIFPIILIILALNTQFWIAAILAVVLGLFFILQFVSINSLLQSQVDDEMRGRVMSLYTMTFFGIAPFGNLLAGSVAQTVGIPITLLVSAGLTLALTLVIYARVPDVWRRGSSG